MLSLDLSYMQALPVLPYQAKSLHLVVVGLGGNGSFLARHVACIAAILQRQGRMVKITFIDADRVEESNVPRQNFCQAEIGRYKVEALAERYSDAFGVEIGFLPEFFDPAMVQVEPETLTVMVGCVDRASGRAAMEEMLKENRLYVQNRNLPRTWYLDLGNSLDFGQVALGSTSCAEDLSTTFCLSPLHRTSLLPSPLLQFPALRDPQAEEVLPQTLSCAQLLALNAQSLMVNPMMADIAGCYLYEFLVLGTLRRFSTRVDLPTGTMRSRYTTPAQMAEAIACSPSLFLSPSNTPTLEIA